MDILLATNALYENEPEFVALTDALKAEYVRRHKGMGYLRSTANPYPDLPPAWAKPRIILDALAIAEWVVWVDADAAPVGMDADLSGLLKSVPEGKVLMAKDINGWNSGVFACHHDQRTIDWLSHIDAQRGEERYRTGWWEQQAMMDSFGMKEWAGIPTEPPKSFGWNDYPDAYPFAIPNVAHDGGWCVHTPGKPDFFRNKYFSKCLSANGVIKLIDGGFKDDR